MIKKELSITELFGVLSAIALMVSVFSNAFFYYSLDAMWVMSILSPSFYVFEILKVLAILMLSIFVVGLSIDAYQWIIKNSFKFRKKQRLKLNHNFKTCDPAYQKLTKLNNSYEFWQTIFVILVSTTIFCSLVIIGYISTTSLLWNSMLVGLVLGVFTNKEVKRDKALKIFVFIILIIFSACFSGQLKLNSLTELPIAMLKNDKTHTSWYVLDGSQDKLILLNQKLKNEIKVVKFEEIDRISSKKK